MIAIEILENLQSEQIELFCCNEEDLTDIIAKDLYGTHEKRFENIGKALDYYYKRGYII